MASLRISLSSQRERAEIESNRQRLELLASKRNDLKVAIAETTKGNGGCCWVGSTSTNSSFFQFSSTATNEMLQVQLQQVEDEILKLCKQMNETIERGE
mmetsp:Transcript_10302/g.17293  ORF Transcript_10302/g.17293 Transcript_10302/m.17293 type:complete len:99 (+) Transcript_10302:32-328(+)